MWPLLVPLSAPTVWERRGRGGGCADTHAPVAGSFWVLQEPPSLLLQVPRPPSPPLGSCLSLGPRPLVGAGSGGRETSAGERQRREEGCLGLRHVLPAPIWLQDAAPYGSLAPLPRGVGGTAPTCPEGYAVSSGPDEGGVLSQCRGTPSHRGTCLCCSHPEPLSVSPPSVGPAGPVGPGLPGPARCAAAPLMLPLHVIHGGDVHVT